MSVGFKVFIGCAVFLLSPRAFAECPDGAENIAAQAVYDVEQKRTTATEAGPNLVLLAEKCKNNGTVQLKATEMMLKIHDEAKDAKSRYQIVEQAWKYSTAYAELPAHFLPKVVIDGQAFSQHPDYRANIRKAALNGLLYYDALGVGHHPYLASGPAFSTCPKSTSTSDSITVLEWTQKRGAQDDGKDTGAMRLIGKLVAACQNEARSSYRSPARYRAQIQMTMAGRMKDKALALKLAQQAKLDIKAYLGDGGTDRFWPKSKADNLSALLNQLEKDNYLFKNMPPSSREDRLKEGNSGPQPPEMRIDKKTYSTDQAFSEVVAAYASQQGGAEEMQAARDLLRQMFKDSTLVDYEIDMLREIIALEAEDTLQYFYKSQPYARIRTPSADARKQFELLTVPIDFDLAMNGDKTQMERMVSLYTLSPYTAKQVQNYLLTPYVKAWKESSIDNAYRPLRTEIANNFGAIKDLDVSQSKIMRTAIYESLARLDAHDGDKVPDFLYHWTKPSP